MLHTVDEKVESGVKWVQREHWMCLGILGQHLITLRGDGILNSVSLFMVHSNEVSSEILLVLKSGITGGSRACVRLEGYMALDMGLESKPSGRTELTLGPLTRKDVFRASHFSHMVLFQVMEELLWRVKDLLAPFPSTCQCIHW